MNPTHPDPLLVQGAVALAVALPLAALLYFILAGFSPRLPVRFSGAAAGVLIAVAASFPLHHSAERWWAMRSSIRRGLQSTDPFQRYLAYLFEASRAHPALEEYFFSGSLPKAAVARHLDPRAMGRESIGTLSDAELAMRSALLTRVLAGTSGFDCAAFVRGNVGEAQLRAGMATLADPEIRSYAELAALGLSRELQGQAHRSSVRVDVQRALGEATRGMSLDDRRQLLASLAHTEAASDADLCNAGRVLYGAIAKLPQDEASALTLALAGF